MTDWMDLLYLFDDLSDGAAVTAAMELADSMDEGDDESE
jgi:hypothetical protein